jgi:hypothetical protein
MIAEKAFVAVAARVQAVQYSLYSYGVVKLHRSVQHAVAKTSHICAAREVLQQALAERGRRL